MTGRYDEMFRRSLADPDGFTGGSGWDVDAGMLDRNRAFLQELDRNADVLRTLRAAAAAKQLRAYVTGQAALHRSRLRLDALQGLGPPERLEPRRARGPPAPQAQTGNEDFHDPNRASKASRSPSSS